MTCARCPSSAHFNFGNGICLCTACLTDVLSCCRISSSAEAEDHAATVEVPAPSAVAAIHSELPAATPGQAAAVTPIPARDVAAAVFEIPDMPACIDRRLMGAAA